MLPPIDPVEREIGFQPTKLPYDPRHMLAGRSLKGNNYMRNKLINYSNFILDIFSDIFGTRNILLLTQNF